MARLTPWHIPCPSLVSHHPSIAHTPVCVLLSPLAFFPPLSTFNFCFLCKARWVVLLLKTRPMHAKWSSDWDDIIQSVGAFLSYWIRNRREERRITSEWADANSPFCSYSLNPHSQSVFGGTSRAFPMFMRRLNEADVFSRKTSCSSSPTVTALNSNQASRHTKVPQ